MSSRVGDSKYVHASGIATSSLAGGGAYGARYDDNFTYLSRDYDKPTGW